MFKKTAVSLIITAAMLVATTTPAFAQEDTPSNGGGIFSELQQFFQRVLNHNTLQQPNEMMGQEVDEASPSGKPVNTGEQRLNGLVQAGKITDAQKQEILNEVSKIQSEISSWSKSTGLDAAYIYGGLRGPGMDAGVGGQMVQQGRSDDQEGNQKGEPTGERPMMRPQGQQQGQ